MTTVTELLSADRGRGVDATGGPGRFLIEWSAAGHGDRRENIVAFVQRYDTAGGTTLSVATVPGAAVVFAGEDALVGSDYFYAVGDSGGTTRIKVKKAGWYKISGTCFAEATTTNGKSISGGITVNGANFSARHNMSTFGCYNRHTNRLYSSGTVSPFSTLLAADDYLEMVCADDGGGASGTTQSAIDNGIGSSIRVELERDLSESSMGIRIPQREGLIDRMVFAKSVAGSSGDTEIEVLKNGTNILAETASFDTSETLKRIGAAAFSDRLVTPEDELTLSFTDIEDPPARDIYVALWCSAQ